MKSFYFKTFLRVSLLPYIGGTIAHILRLIYNLPIGQMPWFIDWFIILIGGYGGLGLILFAKKIPFKNIGDKIAYGLLIFHLNGSVIFHAYMLLTKNHDPLSVFSFNYSFFALAYFIALGIYVLNLKRRLYQKSNH